MNIEISDDTLHSIIQSELTNVKHSQFGEKSSLEKVVKAAILDITKVKVMDLIKSDTKYVETLDKIIETNIIATFELVAKRIAKGLGESIISAIESEFRTYSD